MRILELLSPSCVRVPLHSTQKQEILDELVDLLTENGLCPDAASVKRAVWERETQRSTGIGEGLAIPHGKCAALPGLVLAIGKPAQPIEFGSIDKKPVQLVILLVSPPDKKDEHIQALGKISKIMTSAEFRQRAYAAQSPMELYALFREAES
ncbi:MAG: PTS sugar transporter subunit IIA [Planctomycetota bacterium]|jgi:fructose-specific phosphotransferase system IIA component|nr:MAG: PTS sugar transporter subunit IIA [Planctomycetota bacterium]RLS96091.1 MAG: PTS sugar transporter subunit IIA [Planctomycetota bacterium]